MLQLKNITKVYKNNNYIQKVIDNVSINFRKSEFVSILGESGSGKTTLLNIIGGLDKSSSGDIKIGNKSISSYSDKELDCYRNNRVGFIFQNYNLISSLSVLKNVELSLTLSGISKKKRRNASIRILRKVGLDKYINKRINELSGGQMQRVAIARALVNNPDIILADEPTGALDSKTSIEIMEILKKISKNKLVIMVTHNKDLASKYSSRIINLKDGKIINDSKPFNKSEYFINKDNNKQKISMLSLIRLSFDNLLTKKKRTFIVSFAGSIGIIGIALILSISKGFTSYIKKVEESTLSNYPIVIKKVNEDNYDSGYDNYINCGNNKICIRNDSLKNDYSYEKNSLKVFKKYLENNKVFKKNSNLIKYSYNLDLNLYEDVQNDIIKVDSLNNQNIIEELADNKTTNKYKLLNGKMPSNYNELLLVIENDNTVDLSTLYSLNLINKDEYNTYKKGNKKIYFNYDKVINHSYKLVLNKDYYQKENNVFVYKANDYDFMTNLISKSSSLKIVGVAKIKDKNSAEKSFLGYTTSLTNYVINNINNSLIVKEQINNKKINVFTNSYFDNVINNYDDNLKKIGVKDINNPDYINIYPTSISAKDKIENEVKKYNSKNNGKYKVYYFDYLKFFLSSATKIVNTISYILIALVSISLVVSSIMIFIVTYISVLERTKEIGILRAIGASRFDILKLFMSETLIEGLFSGVLGISISYVLIFIINKVIYNLLYIDEIASLSVKNALILIIVSMFINILSGVIPSKIASKKDPVKSLKTEVM